VEGTIEFDLGSEESNRNLAIEQMDFGLEEFAFVCVRFREPYLCVVGPPLLTD
jgi:hypothetical protein